MLNSGILDVAIGITFVFILISTLCSAIREGIEAFLKTRATYLEYAIRELLHDRSGSGLAKSFFTHPLIHGLYQDDYRPGKVTAKPRAWHRGRNLPSYIPARSFAAVLIDLAARGPSTDAASADPDLGAVTFESLRASVRNLRNLPVQRAMLSAIDSAQGDLDRVRANLEAWYDGAMDRVSGWYKRSSQSIIFVIALVVVSVLNVNTIVIADHLYRDVAVRDAVVAAAGNASEEIEYSKASQTLAELRLPIGWSRGWSTPGRASAAGFDLWHDLAAPILGLLMTAFAATLGAPLWFDVLNKFMVIRATVKPHEKSREEASEDRQIARKSANGAEPNRPIPPAPAPAGVAAAAPHSHRPQAGPPHDDDIDGCDKPIEDATPDAELPMARGGVA